MNDSVKLLAYRIFDPVKAEAKPAVPPEVEAKPEPAADAKAEPGPEATTEPKPDAQAAKPSDVTPALVKRAHELYEDLGREDVRAVENWEKSNQKAQKDEPPG